MMLLLRAVADFNYAAIFFQCFAELSSFAAHKAYPLNIIPNLGEDGEGRRMKKKKERKDFHTFSFHHLLKISKTQLFSKTKMLF